MEPERELRFGVVAFDLKFARHGIGTSVGAFARSRQSSVIRARPLAAYTEERGAIAPYGGDQVILHWDGHAWTTSLNGAVNLYSGWAAAPDDAWVVGDRQMLHWDGHAWADATFDPSIHFSGVWGTAANDMWAVGNPANGTSAIVVHWDGASWMHASLPPIDGAPISVWGTAADDVWAGVIGVNSSGGSILHFDGATWSAVDTGARVGVYEVAGGARDDVWAFAGNQDPLVHFDGRSWSVQRLPTHPGLNAMWGPGPGQERMVGDRGVMLRRCP
jgi:hypothetical protein